MHIVGPGILAVYSDIYGVDLGGQKKAKKRRRRAMFAAASEQDRLMRIEKLTHAATAVEEMRARAHEVLDRAGLSLEVASKYPGLPEQFQSVIDRSKARLAEQAGAADQIQVRTATGQETTEELDGLLDDAGMAVKAARLVLRRAGGLNRSAASLSMEAYRASREADRIAAVQASNAGGAILNGFGRLFGMGYFQLGLGQVDAGAADTPYAGVYQLATTPPNVPIARSKASAWEILAPMASITRGKRERREDRLRQQITTSLIAQQQKVVAAELERVKAMEALRGQFRSRVQRRLAEIEAEAATATAAVARIRKDVQGSSESFPADLAAEVEGSLAEFELGVQKVLAGANEIGPHTAEQVQYGELSAALVAMRSIAQRSVLLSNRVKQAADYALASDRKLAALVQRRSELESAERLAEQQASANAQARLAAQAANMRRQVLAANAERQAMIDAERAALASAFGRLRIAEQNAALVSRIRSGS